MVMPDIVKRWTRAQVLALPDDGNRYELIDGELLVTPSPRVVHQLAVWALYDRVAPYVRQHRLGLTGLAPSDLDLESDQLVQPDLFVVPLRDGRVPLDWPHFGIPLLIAEVLSPTTALNDRTRKRRRYQASGVREYWIVDVDARVIERWRPDDQRPEILTERIEWQPDASIGALSIELVDYFREAWGEG
jgi:Uma2 family endonuclease